MNAAGQPTVEELVRHAEFVRALGAALIREGEQVDDVVQDAMVSALRRPPQDRERSRGWFATVARNLVLQRRRERVARKRREEGAASREEVASTADIVARHEILDRVAAAVRGLPEAQCAVVLLRFYEGMPTARVAEKLGLPLETTRSRLKRALELLRIELDRTTPNGRAEWMSAVAALIGASASTKAVWSAGWVAGLAAALLIGGIVTFGVVKWRSSAARSRGVAAAAAPIAAPPGAAPLPSTSPAAAPPVATRQEQPARKSATVASEIQVRARVLDGAARPVAGAHAVLRLLEPGAENQIGKSDAIADASGSFDFAMPTRHVADWELTVSAAGMTTVKRAGKAAQLGEKFELGDVVIEPCGAVELRVVGLDGRSLFVKGNAEVQRPAPTDVVPASTSFEQDATHDRFVVDGAPCGQCEVRVTIPGRPLGVLHASVVVPPGARVATELTYRGPDPATCICIELPPSLQSPAPDLASLARVVDASGERVATTLLKGGEYDSTWLIATPAPTVACTLTLEAPGFEPYRREGLLCGARVAVQLRAPSGVTIRAGGTSSPGFPADTVFFSEEEGDLLWSRVVHDGEVAADRTVRFRAEELGGATENVEDMPALKRMLVVAIPSRPVIRVPLDPKAAIPGGTIEVPCGARSDGSTVSGEVIGPDGKPAAACEVQLFTPARVDDGPKSPRIELPLPGSQSSGGGMTPAEERARQRRAFARTRTASDGRFEFVEVPDGNWVVQVVDAAFPDAPDATISADHAREKSGGEPPLVSLKATGGPTLVGRLVGPEGASFLGLSVGAVYDPRQFMARALRGVADLPVPVAADGSFRIGGLDAGRVTLRLTADALTTHEGDHSSQTGFSVSSVGPGEINFATLDVPSTGVLTRDFPAQPLVPAFVKAAVRVDGAVDPTLRVGALPVASQTSLGMTWLVDASGAARLGAYLPGRYVVVVRPADGSWSFTSPTPLDLHAGETATSSIDLTLATATLRLFLGDRPEPLRSKPILCGAPIPEVEDHVAIDFCSATLHTDAEGLVKLRWPRGPLLITAEVGDEDVPVSKITWPPDHDPVDIRLR